MLSDTVISYGCNYAMGGFVYGKDLLLFPLLMSSKMGSHKLYFEIRIFLEVAIYMILG